MGSYNPHIPQILGQEWVPIREEDLLLSPASNALEIGHRFTLATSQQVATANMYLNEFPPGRALGQVFVASIYPVGKEDQSGPIRSVIVPCNAGLISGSGSVVNAVNIADALEDPSDNKFVQFLSSASAKEVSLFFAVNSYQALLADKRILGVNALYVMAVSNGQPLPTTPIPTPGNSGNWLVENDDGTRAVSYGPPTLHLGLVGVTEISVKPLGGVDNFWTSAAPLSDPERLPWVYTSSLQNFEISTAAASRVNLHFALAADHSTVNINYVALEIFFCEETRVAYGGTSFGESGFTGGHRPYVFGANQIRMRNLLRASNPILAAGSYLLTLSSANVGEAGLFTSPGHRPIALSQYPELNALRELYSIPPHQGVQIDIPFPMDQETALGRTFTSVETHVLPQLSLHASGGAAVEPHVTSGAPLTQPHVYGRQAVAQVFGSITAAQTNILDNVITTSQSWPWVRYVARRFGDTTVPLTLTGAGQAVAIAPTEFDELDEILDGWKSVTLRFTTPPTMGAGTVPQFVWSATGETAGNRWEILGTAAPALSGTPGNLLNQAPTTQRLGPATYGQPVSGSAINLGWVSGISPLVSATTDDSNADAFVIFAQEMPTVTGFEVEVLSQAVSGIGQQCGIDPCCIPTDILYNRISWGLPVNTGVAEDSFTRTVVAGLGSADVGGTYTLDGTAANYSVNGSRALFTPNQISVFEAAVLNIGVDFDITVTTGLVNTVVDDADAGLVGRYTDASNYYFAVVTAGGPSIVPSLLISKRVAGTPSNLASTIVAIPSPDAGGAVRLRFMGSGSLLKAKVWPLSDDEPAAWNLETSDTSLTTGSLAGLIAYSGNANDNTLFFDDLTIGPPSYWFGYYELQRMDTVETDWQTIMKATNPGVAAFNDYEARIGIEASYRIRGVDVYDFAGPWSSTITSTLPTPGISGGCVSDGHILVFTSNERQDGSINLAYSSVWMDSQVEEDFGFPEAGFVQLQTMYDRDFVTAFRPLERGGETFSRTVLVQAAAIAPETLADFRSLRDMAWEDTSYICVRDEDGNRWFATVIVPSGRVLRDRRLYLAPVNIIEVTDTPSPVNP